MPAVLSGKILVTGANGFIAMWIIDRLLRHGFAVRAVVRSTEKGEHIKKTFATYDEMIEIAVVPDMIQEGAFDHVVQGVDAVMHTASPIVLGHSGHPNELIDPAVNITLGLLKSTIAHGSSVKRVVITSSCAAILTEDTRPRVFSEVDWNDAAVQEAREKGKDTPSIVKYHASKTLAERAAWDLYAKKKDVILWDLVVVNPPYVFGPILQEVSSPNDLNATMLYWYTVVCGGALEGNQTLAATGESWADVRDIADAHYKVLLTPQAANERFIFCGGSNTWQDWAGVAASVSNKISVGHHSYDPKVAFHRQTYDASKSKVFDMQYRTVSETGHDIIKDFEAKGWLN